MTRPLFYSLHTVDKEKVWVENWGALKRISDQRAIPRPAVAARNPTGKSITAITLTGDRPLAFALCQRWMKNQTVWPDQWIVVDDGKTPVIPTNIMKYVRREPKLGDPQYTLAPNFRAALPLIIGDKIIIIEDDDYYAPRYIEEMSRRLDTYEVVGLARAKYYHLPTGNNHLVGNTTHASLSETGFRNSFLYDLHMILNESDSPYVDIKIWQRVKDRGHLFIETEKPLSVGMKGLPGRGGIGAGHKPGMYRSRDTIDRSILKSWMPRDYQIYLDILNGKLTNENYQSYFPDISDITGITVVHNTKDLIDRAYNSVRKFHLDMPIIIIDGSDPGDPCASYVKGLVSGMTTVVSLGYNIGHGLGMCKGIDLAKTPYALIFDSDIEMLKSPVLAMLEMMEGNTFGVGYIEKAGFDGYHYGARRHHVREGWMPMLHPYFQLINIANYHKFHPYVHHGAPCYLTALDIYKKGLSSKIIKEFPGLGHTLGHGPNWDEGPREIKEYIRHDIRGTCKMRVAKRLPAIEGAWTTNRGQV